MVPKKIIIGQPPIEGRKNPQTLQNRQFQDFSGSTKIFPVIPAYAVTMLNHFGHRACLYDGPASGFNWEQYRNGLLLSKPHVIVWEAKTPTIQAIWECVKDLNKALPNTRIIIVGDHVTALPQETIDACGANNVEVITGGDWDFKLYREFCGEVSDDLNNLPLIDREACHWRDYAYRNGNFKYTPGTYTMFGRDCWWRKGGGCTFCSWTNLYKTFRVCSTERAMAEVEQCHSLGIREIFDDTGTFPVGNWLEDFCYKLRRFNDGKSKRKRVRLGCNMRPGALSREQYKLLGASGFRFILFGLESASFNTLHRLNKGQGEHDLLHACSMAKEAGLDPHVTCMVGYPWETREEALSTINLAKDLLRRGVVDTLQATVCIPYPGTALFAECKIKGDLRTENWAKYDMSRPIMNCPMSDEEVMGMTRGIYKSCLTPQYIARKVFTIRNRSDLQFLFRGLQYLWDHLRDFGGKK